MRLPLVLGAILSLSSVACTGETGPEADDKNDAPGVIGHRAALTECDGTREALAGDSEVPPAEIMSDWIACLAAANDEVVDDLERLLTEAVSPHAGAVRARIGDARKAADELCPVLADSGADADGPQADLVQADCVGTMERNLGRLIDGWAEDIGKGQETIAQDRADFAACYAEFDRANEGTPEQAEITAAIFALNDCVITRLPALRVSRLVDRIVANFPDRTPAGVEPVAARALAVAVEAHGAICEIAGDSNGGGQIGVVLGVGCHTDAVALLDDLIAGFDPLTGE